MAIETTVEPRVKWWAVAYLVICAGIGIWGLYDYAIRLPRNQADFERFQSLNDEFATFSVLNEEGRITSEQRARWGEVDAELQEFGGRNPQEPARWDRPVKLWLYVILSGLLGVVWFGASLILLGRRRYRLEDDGTLVLPGARWSRDEIAGIDMERWMEKSIATVIHADGSRVKLDAYKYRNLHLIIGEIAHRFEPTRWHRDARMVKGDEAGAARDDASSGGDTAREDGPTGEVPRDDSAERAAAPAADGAGPTDPTRT